MQTVIITIHLLVVIALVGVVLIQRSEGGGLGIGGGSGFMTARGTKNALTRLTAILAACFFITSFTLTVLQLVPGREGSDILKHISAQEQKGDANNLLDELGGAKTDAHSADKAGASLPSDSPAQNPAPAESGAVNDGAAASGAAGGESGAHETPSSVPAEQHTAPQPQQ